MTATNPSGLANSTIYYFKVNGIEYSITTGVNPTYQDVASLMQSALEEDGYTVAVVGSAPNQDIRVTNVAVRGWGSKVKITHPTSTPDLFNQLTGFSNFDPMFPSDSEGLQIARVMYGILLLSGLAVAYAADVSYSYFCSGFATLSGSASTSYGLDYSYSTSSGMIATGSSNYTIEFLRIGGGGAIISGNSICLGYVQYVYVGWGEILGFGGAATAYTEEWMYSSSGPLSTSGSALYTIEFVKSSSGSVSCSGSALYESYVQAEYVGSGSAFTLSGASVSYGPLSYSGDGQLVLEGVAVYQDFGFGYEWVAFGEIVTAGEAATSSP